MPGLKSGPTQKQRQRQEQQRRHAPLVLLAEDYRVGSVGVEAIFLAALPGCSMFRVGDVPVGTAFFADGAEVLAEVFEGWAAPEPVTVVDLVHDEAGLKNDRRWVEIIWTGVRSLWTKSLLPRLRTSTMGCSPCSSESLRRVVVWSLNS